MLKEIMVVRSKLVHKTRECTLPEKRKSFNVYHGDTYIK